MSDTADRGGARIAETLAASMVLQVPVLTDALVHTIREQNLGYRTVNVVPMDDLWRSCHDNITRVLQLLAGSRHGEDASEDDGYYDAARETGQRRAEQRMPLDDVLRSFRLGGRLVWEALIDQAREQSAVGNAACSTWLPGCGRSSTRRPRRSRSPITRRNANSSASTSNVRPRCGRGCCGEGRRIRCSPTKRPGSWTCRWRGRTPWWRPTTTPGTTARPCCSASGWRPAGSIRRGRCVPTPWSGCSHWTRFHRRHHAGRTRARAACGAAADARSTCVIGDTGAS